MSVHHRSTDSNIKSSHGNDISPRKRHIKLSNWSQLNASWFASTRIKSSWYYITTFVLVVEENSKWYKKVSEWDYGAKFASSRLEDWDPTEIFAHSCKRFTNSLSRGETSGCGISIVTDAFLPIHYLFNGVGNLTLLKLKIHFFERPKVSWEWLLKLRNQRQWSYLGEADGRLFFSFLSWRVWGWPLNYGTPQQGRSCKPSS